MTVFISFAVVLTLLVMAWIVRPLLRPAPPVGISSERLNASIYRDQLDTLERDLARGVISPADCEATRDELQLRLLDDTEAPAAVQATNDTSFWSGRLTAATIALLMPLGAVGMYWWLGEPAAIDPVASHKANDDQAMKMVDSLAARLKANPDNPKGWAMLARSYKVMGRFTEAEQAFLKAGDLINTEPDLMVDYADLLAVRNNNNIEGKSLELVNKALSINPQHPMGLMMAGVAAYRRGDFKGAVARWETLLALLEPGSPDAQQVETDIADGITWLLARKKTDGGFAEDAAADGTHDTAKAGHSFETALVQTALAAAKQAGLAAATTTAATQALTGMENFLVAKQGTDGGWSGDPFQTALTARALPAVTLADADKDGLPDAVESYLNHNVAVADSRDLPNGNGNPNAATTPSDGDVPLPLWSLVALGAGLLGAMRKKAQRSESESSQACQD